MTEGKVEKVLVVDVGEYSDYRVVGIYSMENRKLAEASAKLIGGEVCEWDLNGFHPEDPGLDYFRFEMTKDGKVSDNDFCYKLDRLDNKGDRYKNLVWLKTYKDSSYRKKSYWRLTWYGYHESKEHAIRSANELRRQILDGQRPECVDMGKN